MSIIVLAGQAQARRCRLMSNVRPRGKHLFMRLLAPSPALMNASLRTRRQKYRAPAADTKDKNSVLCFSILVKFISGGVRDGVKALRASSQSPHAGGQCRGQAWKVQLPRTTRGALQAWLLRLAIATTSKFIQHAAHCSLPQPTSPRPSSVA
jgi:hypothetical protein